MARSKFGVLLFYICSSSSTVSCFCKQSLLHKDRKQSRRNSVTHNVILKPNGCTVENSFALNNVNKLIYPCKCICFQTSCHNHHSVLTPRAASKQQWCMEMSPLPEVGNHQVLATLKTPNKTSWGHNASSPWDNGFWFIRMRKSREEHVFLSAYLSCFPTYQPCILCVVIFIYLFSSIFGIIRNYMKLNRKST